MAPSPAAERPRIPETPARAPGCSGHLLPPLGKWSSLPRRPQVCGAGISPAACRDTAFCVCGGGWGRGGGERRSSLNHECYLLGSPHPWHGTSCPATARVPAPRSALERPAVIHPAPTLRQHARRAIPCQPARPRPQAHTLDTTKQIAFISSRSIILLTSSFLSSPPIPPPTRFCPLTPSPPPWNFPTAVEAVSGKPCRRPAGPRTVARNTPTCTLPLRDRAPPESAYFSQHPSAARVKRALG